MKWNYAIAGVLILSCTYASAAWGRQDDFPSAFDKCRIVTTADLTDKRAPVFNDYRVASPETVGNPKVDLTTNPIARMYPSVLRQEISHGPNFAGHYRLAAWGCGSSCTMLAVVNLNTGRVITPEGFSRTSGVYFAIDTQKLLPKADPEYSLLAFRKDSNLLAVFGDLDEDERREGAFYLLLEHDHLRLIHSTRVRKDCEDLRDQR